MSSQIDGLGVPLRRFAPEAVGAFAIRQRLGGSLAVARYFCDGDAARQRAGRSGWMSQGVFHTRSGVWGTGVG